MSVDATQCSDSLSETVYMTKFKPMDQRSCAGALIKPTQFTPELGAPGAPGGKAQGQPLPVPGGGLCFEIPPE